MCFVKFKFDQRLFKKKKNTGGKKLKARILLEFEWDV